MDTLIRNTCVVGRFPWPYFLTKQITFVNRKGHLTRLKSSAPPNRTTIGGRPALPITAFTKVDLLYRHRRNHSMQRLRTLLSWYSGHKTRCTIYFRMRNVVISSTEPRKLGPYHTSNSCRKRHKNGDNLLVLSLMRHTKTRDVTPRSSERGGETGFPLCSHPPSVGALVDHVTLLPHKTPRSRA